MDAVDLSRHKHEALSITNRDALVSRYKRLRAAGRGLSDTLVKRLSKDVLEEGGKKLGIFRDRTFFFETEDESSVLMDYCIFDIRRNGRNAIEQYLIDCPPDSTSDEMTYLRSMQSATYSLFVVESVEPGLGVIVRDLISPKILLVVDMSLGSSAQPGLFFASRLLHCDEFSFTSGTALPIAVIPAQEREALAKKLFGMAKRDDRGYFDPGPLIHTLLSMGCSSHVGYADVPGVPTKPRRIPNSLPRPRVGRNDPCPCGSGKKSKRCCLNG